MKRTFLNTVRRPPRYWEFLVSGLLLTLAFGLAAWLGPRLEAQFPERADLDDPLAVLLGDTRQLFANSFFVKADAYYHSGYYPTIFDNNEPFKTPHIGEDSGTMESKNSGDENGFLGRPHDWIERLNRNFFPSYHTHLDQGGVDGEGETEVKEIMPWLKISAELDEHRIETYLVTAYWLRVRMFKVNEAEQFLRDGLHANPGNAALLFELGRLYFDSRNQPVQARNLYLAALDSWGRENSGNPEPDKFLLSHILSSLAKLEGHEGNNAKAIRYFKMLKPISPSPDSIQKRIDELSQQPASKP
ncbi:MAG: tetratricopeptide repeat protein [Limisphaerales bacterium]